MVKPEVQRTLAGKVALVAGATRGAGRAIAVELCRAGAFVYATGRSSRVTGPSELQRSSDTLNSFLVPRKQESSAERRASADDAHRGL